MIERLEYNDLQDLSCEEKLRLLDKDLRYFELIENPSVMISVVYSEKMLAHVKSHSELYRAGKITLKKIIDRYLGNRPLKEETMKELKVYRNNAIHFIRR